MLMLVSALGLLCVLCRLSSFVAKCFHEAKDYIAVEEEKIANTLDWIVRHQARNGSFHEPPEGRVCHTAMQVVAVVVVQNVPLYSCS